MRLSICYRLVVSPHALLTHFQFGQENAFYTIIKPFSSASSHNTSISEQKQQEQQQSFVISYLINSCGLSPERAKLSSCKLKFKTPDRPDSVLAFFRKHGFTNAHIAKLVSWDTRWLNCKSPEKTLLPKFEFFYSIGVSRDCLPDIICGSSTILSRSLKNGIIPACNILRSMVSCDKQVVTILKRRPWLFFAKDTEKVIPNVEFLKGIGVPQSKIACLVSLWSDALFLNHDEFCNRVNEVVDMGFDVSKTAFVWGLCAIFNERSKEMVKRSFKVYEKCGWSSDDILSVFRKYPQCMFLSEENIMKTMDFFVNKIGVDSREIRKCPVTLCYSFEKRIRPRYSVIWFLKQKGLLNKSLKLGYVLHRNEESFLQMFVTEYTEDAPQLLSIYQGKVDPFKA